MTTDIVTRTTNELVSFNQDQIDTLRRTICNDLNDDELHLFTMICTKHGLDPFARQIYALKRKVKKKTVVPNANGRGTRDVWTETDVMQPQTSIDGFRLIAQRTGKYRGQMPPEWTADGKEWLAVWLSDTPPAACRISVLRSDFDTPLTVTYTWREYTGGQPSHMQKKMPAHMLAKATEALALRKAFPNELSGLYTTDEIADDVSATAIGEPTVTPTPRAKPRRAPKQIEQPAPPVETEPVADETPDDPPVDDVTKDRLLAEIREHGDDVAAQLGEVLRNKGVTWGSLVQSELDDVRNELAKLAPSGTDAAPDVCDVCGEPPETCVCFAVASDN